MASARNSNSTPTKSVPLQSPVKSKLDDLVPVDSGKSFILVPADQVSFPQYDRVSLDGYSWWVLASFVDLDSSPYGRVQCSKDGISYTEIRVEPTYLRSVKSQHVFQDVGRSPPYKTRAATLKRDVRNTKSGNSQKPSTGSDTLSATSKNPVMSTASPNKSIPVPYIRGNTKIPQIPVGQTVNAEFVREELYSRIDEIYVRLDDPSSGVSTELTKLSNTVNKLKAEKSNLEEKVAVLESEVTASKIGLKDKVSVIQTQIKTIQGELRTLKAKNMELVTDGTDKESVSLAFDDYEKFKKAVEEENGHLARQLEWLVASVDQNSMHIDHLQIMTASNAEKLMQNTIKIGGVEESKDSKPRQDALSFLKDTMKLKFDANNLYFAFRKGNGEKSRHSDGSRFPRFLHVRVAPQLYHKIWNNRKSLAGKKSPNGWKFFVSLTKPAIIRAADRRYADRIKSVIEQDKEKDKKDRRFARVSNGKFFIGSEYQPDPIEPPSLRRRVQLESTQGARINSFELLESSIYPLEGSNNFQAFATRVADFSDVELAYCRIKKDNVYAAHIIMACYFEQPGAGNMLFSCDDGEHEAGMEVEKLLQENGIANLAVFVTRYRFKHFELGPKRFVAIREVTRKVLDKVNNSWAPQDGVATDSASDGEPDMEVTSRPTIPEDQDMEREDRI